MIKCVIFDCDGTLVDSERLAGEALSIKLAQYGIFESCVKLTDQNRGAKFVDILQRLALEHNVVFREDFAPEFRTLVAEYYAQELQAFPKVEWALSSLNIAMCVASNAPVNQLNLAIEVTGLKKYFNENLYSAYEVESWKPDPGLFLHAAAQMGVQAEECLVVEDSPVGISAGKAAGMQTVLYDPQDRYGSLPFDFKISCMSELVAVVAKLSKSGGLHGIK